MQSSKAYKGLAMEGVVAKWYAKITRDEGRFQPMIETLLGKIPSGSQVLEIAPGPGYFAISLAQRGGYQVTGVDISKSFVEIARQNAAQAGVEVNFHQGNASDLPFADETFDCTFCQAAFKNFTQPVRAIAEMYRVLRPHGAAVINDLRRDASLAEINRHVASMGLNGFNQMMTRWTFQRILLKNAYTVAEMRAFVSQTKFQQRRVDADDIGFTIWLAK